MFEFLIKKYNSFFNKEFTTIDKIDILKENIDKINILRTKNIYINTPEKNIVEHYNSLSRFDISKVTSDYLDIPTVSLHNNMNIKLRYWLSNNGYLTNDEDITLWLDRAKELIVLEKLLIKGLHHPKIGANGNKLRPHISNISSIVNKLYEEYCKLP